MCQKIEIMDTMLFLLYYQFVIRIGFKTINTDICFLPAYVSADNTVVILRKYLKHKNAYDGKDCLKLL